MKLNNHSFTGILKKNKMNNKLIIYIFTFVLSLFGVRYYYQTQINKLSLENEILITENKSLYDKIKVIESSFDKFMNKGVIKNNKKSKTTNNRKKIVDNSKNELIQIKQEISSLDKTLDSIKHTLPNRTGQDLINSLKLKTSL